MSDYAAFPCLSLRVYSLTDAQAELIFSLNERTSILNAQLTFSDIGGIKEFEIEINKNTNVVLYSGMRIDFYHADVLLGTGYTSIVPAAETGEKTLKIKGKGFAERMRDIIVNKTYSSVTLENIIKDLGSTYLDSSDIIYDSATITNIPALTPTKMEFKDKSLYESFETLKGLANYEYETQEYIWYVGNNRKFYFEQANNTLRMILFEGYHFQDIDVLLDDTKVINNILAYRTKETDQDTVEYVNGYTDTVSMAIYGERQKKIVFADYADNTTIQNICNAIIEKRKYPIKKATINKFIHPGDVSWEAWNIGINSKPEERLVELSNGGDTGEWDLSNCPNTLVEVDSTKVFTGRNVFKITTGTDSYNEYMELDLDNPIWFPLISRLFFYYDSDIFDLKVEFESTNGLTKEYFYGSAENNLVYFDGTEYSNAIDHDGNNFIVQQLETADYANHWLKRNMNLEVSRDRLVLNEDPGTGEEVLYEDTGTLYDYILEQTEAYLINVKKIRIVFLTDVARVLYFDRLDISFGHWFYNELRIRTIKYSWTKDKILADIQLGDSADSLIDEINDKVDKGNVALDVFAKQ